MPNPDNHQHLSLRNLAKKDDLGRNRHLATDDIVTTLLDTVTSIRDSHHATSIDGLQVEDDTAKAEVLALIEELRYTAEQVNLFLNSGSREKLLKYFTEEQLEQPGFFAEANEKYATLLLLVRLVIADNQSISLLSIYGIVSAFRTFFIVVSELSHQGQTLISEVIKDDSRVVEQNLNSELLQIAQELSSLHGQIFSWLFIRQQVATVGAELLDNVRAYIPELQERLSTVEKLLSGDVSLLPVTENKLSDLSTKINRHMTAVRDYLTIIADPTKTEFLIAQNRDSSEIKWMNNMIGPLAELLYELVS